MMQRLGFFGRQGRQHWAIRALTLSVAIAGAGFVIGRCGNLMFHGGQGPQSLAKAKPDGLLTNEQSKTCLSWAIRVANSTDEVLEDEALRFLTVAAVFDLNPELEKGIDRLRTLALRQREDGQLELTRRLAEFFPEDSAREGGSNTTPRPDWAQQLIENSVQAADGRLEDLVLGYPTFLMVVEAYGEGDPRLWRGMERLARLAKRSRSEQGYEIAKRMISSFEVNAPPPQFAHLTGDLQDLVRRWELTRRK